MPADKLLNQTGLLFTDSMTVDKSTFYDIRASVYDEQNDVPARIKRRKAIYAYYTSHLYNTLPKRITYLDFGCGTGKTTKEFVAELRGHVVSRGIAIDVSQRMVDLSMSNLPDFTIIKGGPAAIDFPGSIDLITAHARVVSELTDNELLAFFRNAYRSLKSGGFLCFDAIKQLEIGEHGFTQDDNNARRNHLVYFSKRSDGSRVLDALGRPIAGVNRMFTGNEIISLARDALFTVTEVKEFKVDPDPKGRLLSLTDLATVLSK